MKQPLRAVVIGAGWAGEGQTKALRYAGVEVVAICAHQSAVVQQVADRLSVAQTSADWRQRLETVCPDIVALATPAVLRTEVVEIVADLGCHLLVEFPHWLPRPAKPVTSTSECKRQKLNTLRPPPTVTIRPMCG